MTTRYQHLVPELTAGITEQVAGLLEDELRRERVAGFAVARSSLVRSVGAAGFEPATPRL